MIAAELYERLGNLPDAIPVTITTPNGPHEIRSITHTTHAYVGVDGLDHIGPTLHIEA